MQVLSLFDGISTGQLCLRHIGFDIEKYYASEIEESAIAITQHNFPETIQLGDVNNWKNWDIEWDKIDLLIGGSPCQNLSIIGVGKKEDRKGLEGEKSGLFYKYVEILNHLKSVNPKVKFLLENNFAMPKADEEIITKLLGVEPIMIDAAEVSPQSRKRFYWCNWEAKTPSSNDIFYHLFHNFVLKDILQPSDMVDDKYWYNYDYEFNGKDKNPICTLKINCFKMGKRVSNPNSKCYTLTCVNGGYTHKKVYQDGRNRKLTPIEYERCQNLPDDYTKYGVKDGKQIIMSDTARYNACGNGWNANVIKHIFLALRNTVEITFTVE